MTRSRILACVCACVLLCGCANKPAIVHTFVPGETPPMAVHMPRGTRISTPDGKEYVLGDDGVVLSVGHWVWVLSALEYEMRKRRRVPDMEM